MGNIYLFYGEEKYDIESRIEKIKKEYNMLESGVNLFYVNLDNINELENIAHGVTFFGNEKLIIIKDTKLKFSTDILKELDEEVKVIIVEDSIDKRLSEYKKLSKYAECIEFKKIALNDMAQYVINLLKKYGLNINYETAEYFVNVCGDSKLNNINELQKIVIYMDKNGEVTKDIIDKVCSKTMNAKMFDVLNLVVNKNKKKAIQELDSLLKQKEPIVKIYISLYRQFKQLYLIKTLKQNKSSNIAEESGIHPYAVKTLLPVSEKYSFNELKKILYEFDNYDSATKNGDMDFEIGLKKIICMI